jgi:hypothetical protein
MEARRGRGRPWAARHDGLRRHCCAPEGGAKEEEGGVPGAELRALKTSETSL